jgi:hypothetical protein
MEDKEITPEQRKELSKILSKAKMSMSFLAIKFCVGLFAANLISIGIGAWVLQGLEPETQAYFQFFAVAVNMCFMGFYLNGRLKAINADTVEKIKEVIKKQD